LQVIPELSTPFYLSYAALWILVVFQSLLLLGMVRIVYQLQKSGVTSNSNALSQGQEAPLFSAVDLSGTAIGGADFAGKITALLFVTPDCPACVISLEKDLDYLQYKAQGNLIVICKAIREECVRLAERYEITVPVVADEDESISSLYRISSVPTVVLIDADGRVQSYGQPVREEELTIEVKEAEVAVEG
jgi:peroxiredoxin